MGYGLWAMGQIIYFYKSLLYKSLLMCIMWAPDIYQLIVMDLLGELYHALVYIDRILIIQRVGVGELEEDHITKKIKQV